MASDYRTTFVSLLLIALIRFTRGANEDFCYTPSNTHPRPSEFSGRSSMTQVMIGSPIRCTGKLTHWSFISTNKYVNGVTFFVWRPFSHKPGNAYFTTVGTFELAGEKIFEPFVWVTVPSDPPINVQEGDVIGVYYDDWRLDDYFAFIPVSPPTRIILPRSNLTLVNTLVSAKSRSDVIYESLSKGVVDLSEASKVLRQIALQARIETQTSRLVNKLRNGICQLPPDPGSCLGIVPSFYYDSINGDCRPFIYGGCNGNANRFHSAEQCSAVCNNLPPFDSALQIAALKTLPLLPIITTSPQPPRRRSTSTMNPTPKRPTPPLPAVTLLPTTPAPTWPATTAAPPVTKWRENFSGLNYLNLNDPKPNRLPSPTKCIDLFQTKQYCDRTILQIKFFFNVAKTKCEPFFHYADCVTSANIFPTREECNFNCEVLEREPSLLNKLRNPIRPVLGQSLYVYVNGKQF